LYFLSVIVRYSALQLSGQHRIVFQHRVTRSIFAAFVVCIVGDFNRVTEMERQVFRFAEPSRFRDAGAPTSVERFPDQIQPFKLRA
jgi:hypothetical protein